MCPAEAFIQLPRSPTKSPALRGFGGLVLATGLRVSGFRVALPCGAGGTVLAPIDSPPAANVTPIMLSSILQRSGVFLCAYGNPLTLAPCSQRQVADSFHLWSGEVYEEKPYGVLSRMSFPLLQGVLVSEALFYVQPSLEHLSMHYVCPTLGMWPGVVYVLHYFAE